MRSLFLFRHAKSNWDNPSLSDHDRQLSARGRGAAPRMGRYIVEQSLMPDLIICSTAVRTRETLRLALPDIDGGQPMIVFDADLYECSLSTLLDIVQGVAADVKTLMLIGHNPGLQLLALTLAHAGDSDHYKRITHKFPTAALATLTFDVDDWSFVRPGTGELRGFMTPKLLD
ncbi:MAG: SixA phosphatase family protein [Hyphomicrobiaceae bacterium]